MGEMEKWNKMDTTTSSLHFILFSRFEVIILFLHLIIYYVVLYCTVLYCTVLYCTVLYCTVLYCTVLYCTDRDKHVRQFRFLSKIGIGSPGKSTHV